MREQAKRQPESLFGNNPANVLSVPPGQQVQIFDIFMQEDATLTRKYEGSGLGLSIAKGMVDLPGGIINLKSLRGTGSEFYFTIPL